MLKKLLRYDFSDLLRFMLPATAAALACAALGGGVIRLIAVLPESMNFLHIMIALLLMACIIGLVLYACLPTIWVLIRYYRSLFTDEGFLTFTLPVPTSSILTSKIISGFIVTLCGTLISGICISLFFILGLADYEFLTDNLYKALRELASLLTGFGQPVKIVSLTVISGLASQFLFLNSLFLAFTVSGLKAGKHKVLFGILMYVAISLVTNMVQSISSVAFDYTGAFSSATVVAYLLLYIAISLGIAMALYLINRKLLTSRLELN